MEIVFETFQQILDPDWIMRNGGLYLVLLILFIETGVIIGFFLPGDPLLFIAGMVIASADEAVHLFSSDVMNLIFWMILFATATILGYFLGYWFGEKFGPRLRKREDSWLFKKKYIDSAHDFYEKRGAFAVTISRFLPVVRTFTPIIGGMVKMKYKKFVSYNIIGAIIWVGSITTLGFLLGENPKVQENLEWVILGIVAIVTLPVIFKMIFSKEEAKA